MKTVTIIILIHQLLFQGMFMIKNIAVARKTGKQIRGKNREANFAITFFILFIALSLVLSNAGSHEMLSPTGIAGLVILALNLTVSVVSLIDLRDSWRVGVVENSESSLVTTGIYRYSRNPYFLSYFLLFIGYTTLLTSWILLILTFVGFGFVHWMVKKEERYLQESFGDEYREYMTQTPRYFLV